MYLEVKRMFAKEFFGTGIKVQLKLMVDEDEYYWLSLSGLLDLSLFKCSLVSSDGKEIVIKTKEMIQGSVIGVADIMTGELVIRELVKIANGLPSIVEITKKYKQEEVIHYKLYQEIGAKENFVGNDNEGSGNEE